MSAGNQVSSALFVGREKELTRFRRLLTPEATLNILNIHTCGDGGVGKTKLVLRMQEYCVSEPDNLVAAKELIDFYHTESRSKLGVMQQIVENLAIENFPEFSRFAEHYLETPDVSEREELLPKLEEAFRRDYTAFSDVVKTQQKVIVLFFDTYEFIQGVELTAEGISKATTTGFSHWIETQLFPAIRNNTRLIVSGRFPLTAADRKQLAVEELNLSHFTIEDTKAFWKRCLEAKSDRELSEKIGSEELISTVHTLADGRPVLLALFADWLNYSHNPLSPEKLLARIEGKTGKPFNPITEEHKELFEKALIERIASFRQSEDQAVVHLAVAYRRMTPEMFQFLTDAPLEECREILLSRLEPLSFTKYKKGDVILLHDEMRRLVVQHWWEEQDAAKDDRRTIAKDLVTYYDTCILTAENLSEVDRETYTSELLGYALLADPQTGITRFCDEFDIALEDGRYDYCDLLLREAENYRQENPHDIPFPDFLEIDLRRIRYYTGSDRNYHESIALADAVLEKFQETEHGESSVIRGKLLMERAIAEFSVGEFTKSIPSFKEVQQIFYHMGENSLLPWTNNLIGYTYYRQGKFAEAEEYLEQARDEYQELLGEGEDLDQRERRRLFQGLQLSLGNLAIVYSHTGKFEKAIRNAEITLDIVRNLPHNTIEIARTRNTVGQVFAFAGLAIDAHYHLVEAEKLLEGIGNRQIVGRIKTNLGFLQYRVNEFAHLLEYYRAEDIEKILKYVRHDRIDDARKLVEEAVTILSTEPVITKELADTYYALGELYMVSPSDDHWEQAEQAFQKSLKWGKASQFLYRIVDTLESLITLYYFWNGASTATDSVRKDNQEKFETYQREIEQFDSQLYPNLFGKYHITLGDISFDKALENLRSSEAELIDSAKVEVHLNESFEQYTKAAVLMRQFNEKRYYLILRVFYNRLNTLLDVSSDGDIATEVFTFLDTQRSRWQQQIREFEDIFYYVALRIQSEERLASHLDGLLTAIQQYLDHGNFGMALLLNDCLIGMYLSLINLNAGNDIYHEHLILRLHVQHKLYRILGDEYQARRYLRLVRRRLKAVTDPHVKEALEGWTDAGEGTLIYRRGEYGKLLEFYLEDELDTARNKFDGEFPGERQRALELLQEGEKKLGRAIALWEEKLATVTEPDEQTLLNTRLKIYRKHFGETQFRIGELLTLHERFSESGYQKRAFSYLKQAVNSVTTSGALYRHDDAVQSYINALYFSGNYENPEYQEERLTYEHLLDDKLSSSAKIYPSILAKFRITQGDALFSKYFHRQEAPEHTFKEYGYIPRQRQIDTLTLRTMLRYYVEACNFMAQHGSIDFASSVRVLQRRIELISDKHSLREIRRALRSIWTVQPYLKEEKDVLDTLVQFVKIRSFLLEHERNISCS